MEPLSEADSHRAEDEALKRTLQSSEEAIESRRRGRIEAETRRISEEVTRQAQERLHPERGEHTDQTHRAYPYDVATETGKSGPRDAVEMNVPDVVLPKAATIERVLVPLDGTSYAERALPYCLALATLTNASVVLAHVQETAPGRARKMLSKALVNTTADAPMNELLDVATYLNAIRERLRSSVARIETATLSADTASDGLVALLATAPADVVVLATRARQGLERRLLGSVGDALIQFTHVPLLLIPPGVEVNAKKMPVFRRILVPLDGSAAAEQALAPVLALANRLVPDGQSEMDIVLYYVAESRVTRPDGVRYLEEVRERLIESGLPATFSITATAMVGSPPGSITSAAIHGLVTEAMYPERFDLIAMATQGRGGFQRWLYGSVAEYVLSHVPVPILLVRPERTNR